MGLILGEAPRQLLPKYLRSLLATALLCASAMAVPCPSGAQDSATTASPATAPTAASAPEQSTDSQAAGSQPPAPAGSTAAPLKGQVQLIEINLAEVRDLGLDVKHVRHAATSLYDEVSRQPVQINTMPEMVGMGTIIQIPVSFSGTGYLPPRKKAIEGAMQSMRPFIELSKQDVDEYAAGHRRLDISDHTRQLVKPLTDEWVVCISDAYAQFKTLEDLTKGPGYDNGSIASAAAGIDRDMKRLEKAVKEFYKILQKEGGAK
jgi:hypothetical protein